MFSYWLGKIAGKDIRQAGDGNPGAVNALKSGGWKIGVPAMLLDFLKGFIPIFVVNYYYGISNIRLALIAIMPILGHAFSPFLNFKGGKAIAPSFGVWAGLTFYQGPTVLGLSFAFFRYVVRIKKDAWVTVLGFVVLLIYLLLFNRNLTLLLTFLGNLSVIIYKHWSELKL